jgi:hypothetical protein
MVTAFNSISTETAGWREKCRAWAEERQPFEIRDMGAAHFLFCHELCAEYDYSYQYRCQHSESIAQFKPIE